MFLGNDDCKKNQNISCKNNYGMIMSHYNIALNDNSPDQ